MSGAVDKVTFEDLLKRLANAHESDLQALRDDHAAAVALLQKAHSNEISAMSAETEVFPEQLMKTQEGSIDAGGENNVEKDDILALTEDKVIPVERITYNIKGWWLQQSIWGKDKVTFTRTPGVHLLPEKKVTKEDQGNFFGCLGGVILPHSNFRTCWDLVSLVIIIIDILTLPFTLAFKPSTTTANLVMDWFSLLFWTADMIQGPFLGYFRQGQYISSHTLVMKHYLKTWFLVDVVVVFPEWFAMVLLQEETETTLSVAAMGKALKAIRVIRVLRLLRVAKVKDKLEVLYDLSTSEITFVLLEVLQLIAILMVFNHIIACAWYALANHARERGQVSWIRLVDPDDQADLSMSFLYLTSLHWSLTQFTPSGMKVSATSEAETILSIIVLLFALLVFSSFLASISTHMARLRSLGSSPTKQLWLVRGFLKHKEFSSDLSKRIYKYVEHKLSKEAVKLKFTDQDLKQNLSRALSDELAFEMYANSISCHPFFRCLIEVSQKVMHKACERLLNLHMAAKSELIFSPGDEGKHMYILQSGELEYNSQGEVILVEVDTCNASSMQWVSEAVLWVAWRHRGELMVRQHMESELLFVDPTEFYKVLSEKPRPWLFAAIYGGRFVEYINKLPKLMDIITDKDFYVEATGRATSVSLRSSELVKSHTTTSTDV